jgi:molybdopterin synthase sulfur carrier subunit
MPRVELTRHLYQFFPDLEHRTLEVGGATVREVVDAMEALAPGFAFYVCDERGRLRQHVNVFIENDRVRDRATLTDPVQPTSRVSILQALSGG